MMADDLFVIDVELFLNHFFMFFEAFFVLLFLGGADTPLPHSAGDGCAAACGIVKSIIKAV